MQLTKGYIGVFLYFGMVNILIVGGVAVFYLRVDWLTMGNLLIPFLFAFMFHVGIERDYQKIFTSFKKTGRAAALQHSANLIKAYIGGVVLGLVLPTGFLTQVPIPPNSLPGFIVAVLMLAASVGHGTLMYYKYQEGEESPDPPV